MKKVLSVLILFALLGFVCPANAAPPPMGGQIIQAGPHFGPHGRPYRNWDVPPPPRMHNSGVIVGGVLARRSYWSYPYRYNCRLGWCDDFVLPLSRTYYNDGIYINLGFPIRY